MALDNICRHCLRRFGSSRGVSVHQKFCLAHPSTLMPDGASAPTVILENDFPVPMNLDDEIPEVPTSPQPVDPDLTCTPDTTRTIRYSDVHGPDSVGRIYGPAESIYSKHMSGNWNPWSPFYNEKEYELVQWFIEHDLSKTAIQDYTKLKSGKKNCRSFRSADECWSLIECSEFGLRPESWRVIEFEGKKVYTRDILACIRLLLAHLPFKEDLEYSPIKYFDSTGRRIFNEISSGEWWWQTQVFPASFFFFFFVFPASSVANLVYSVKSWKVVRWCPSYVPPIKRSLPIFLVTKLLGRYILLSVTSKKMLGANQQKEPGC
jgi:hypothetical protein